MATFSERLKLLRKNKNLSQRALAELTGLSEGAIQSYELELRKPSLDVLSALADYFDISVDYLIGRSDYPERN